MAFMSLIVAFLMFTVTLSEMSIPKSLTTLNELDSDLYVVKKGDVSGEKICSSFDADLWSIDFHNCFFEKKYKDDAQDLNNIVTRILKHATTCVNSSKQECRLKHGGFMVVIKKIINQIKDYTTMYLEEITKGREDIKELTCVEEILSIKSYEKCFKKALEKTNTPREELEKDIKIAISCTNREHNGCSKESRTAFNRMVRTIMGVPQPRTEDIEDKVEKKEEKPWRWYDYIIQPFISLWKTVTSWFGF